MAKRLTAKFKNLRRVVKAWQSHLSNLKENIRNVKLILEFLCMIEEFRDLTLMEWNFKAVLEDKLLFLLRQQKIYRKQRCSIRWVKEDDVGTNFFHAHATIKHRRNLITCLEDSDGTSHTTHQSKAIILWEACKDRLGTIEFNSMLLDLSSLLQNSEDLS